MSIIGDKIHRIRDFRGMTQKQLGMAVGFDEKSADVRIAQYESGTRTPKQALVELLAEALDVNPRFLADDEILGAEGVMMMLFELDEGLIRLKKVFRVISRLSGKDTSYIPGDHELSPNMSYEAMIEELCYNHAQDREYVRVTFTEGTNLLDIAKQLEENEVCDAEEFVFYFNAGGYGFKFEDYIPKNEPLRFQNREGYCFPDTYEFYVGEDPEIVVQKIYENFDKKITSADYRAMDELGMTLDDVITLSSIVQAEAPSFEDMKMVAGVFHNRLNNPGVFTMLQSDPTRKYAEEVIQPYLASQQREDPLMCNEYNTYIGQGLPPGAINNPGKDAITAVLYPESSNYYYFVANVQTGETFYAVDLKAHNDNIAKIKQQQAEAGLADDGDN